MKGWRGSGYNPQFAYPVSTEQRMAEISENEKTISQIDCLLSLSLCLPLKSLYGPPDIQDYAIATQQNAIAFGFDYKQAYEISNYTEINPEWLNASDCPLDSGWYTRASRAVELLKDKYGEKVYTQEEYKYNRAQAVRRLRTARNALDKEKMSRD